MNIFAGKKALCFLALPHHNRILLPIMQELTQRGMEVVYCTAAAEAAFELTLNQAGLTYRHALDYATPEVVTQITEALHGLRPVWLELFFAHPELQAGPLPIQDKVIRSAIENTFCFQRMIEVEKPDLLFALHELNMWGKLLGHFSHVYRIPYITFQEGLCYAAAPLYRFHTDYSTACVVWGEADRQVLLAAGCSPDKTVALGNIDLWEAKKRTTQSDAMAETRKKLAVGPSKKLVVFLMSHAPYNRFQPEVFLRWLKARGDVEVVFKWHPVAHKDMIEKALGDLTSWPFIHSVQDFDTYALLAASDVCITVGNSTTGIEALVFGKPLIDIALPDQAYSFAGLGVAEPATGFEDIGPLLEQIFAHGLTAERKQHIEAYLAQSFASQDGNTVGRVVQMAEEMLLAKQPEVSHPPVLPVTKAGRFPCSLILPVDDTPLPHVMATLRGIAAHVPAELFDIIIVNAAAGPETRALLESLGGDIRVMTVAPGTSFADCCNRAAAEAEGTYVVFLKPGLVPCQGWLEGLLEAAQQEPNAGVIGGRVANENGLLWHIGVAFDINQSPFSLYRLLPVEFVGALRQREFRAVEVPFLVAREQFCRCGGFAPDLVNRFEDVDFCLRLREAGLRVLYTPHSVIFRSAESWRPTAQQDRTNCFHFYARWSGSLWQDDDTYLTEDGIDRATLSGLYRELAGRIAVGTQQILQQPVA